MGWLPAAVSCSATSLPPSQASSSPPGSTTSPTLWPMQDLGTEDSRPLAPTGIVGGTTCQEGSSASEPGAHLGGAGPSRPSSLRKGGSGGGPVVRLGPSFERARMRAIARSSPSQPEKSPS